ncbi:MAG: phosphoglucosamine mutase [Clostridiales bacterium]|nr:phosphoglucosamine mutase [Clostridiales bacterium]
MGIYFGTDGIRGQYGKDINPKIAYNLGNSIAKLCKNRKKILIGRDTRASGDVLLHGFVSGVLSYGIDIIDVGITPTPVISYLTKKLNFDYGVVISASHNPSNHNGIKIFNREGCKLDEIEESSIEKNLIYPTEKISRLGKYFYKPKLIKLYKNEVYSHFNNLSGLKVAVDCANGATSKLAKELFTKCRATVLAINTSTNGKKINKNCGALFPEKISNLTTKLNCDIGFSFDGDGDRIIACDEKGKILDGDDILFLLSDQFKAPKVVGTITSNKGLELALKEKNIEFFRADVGDKNVRLMMQKQSAFLGGETCGHIINSQFSNSGDGILTALSIAQHLKTNQTKLSQMTTFKKFPQVCKNVSVSDKQKILSSPPLQKYLSEKENVIQTSGRIVVRASGTENKIRIMCEHQNPTEAQKITDEISAILGNLDKND